MTYFILYDMTLFNMCLVVGYRGRWQGIYRSGTRRETGRPRTEWHSTWGHTSSRRDTSWMTVAVRWPTGARATVTFGSTARRAGATWKNSPGRAGRTRGVASGWKDGSCSIASPGRCHITAADPTTTYGPSPSTRKSRKKSVPGPQSAFR